MNIEEELDNKPCNGCGAMTEHGCPEMKDCLEYHDWNKGINPKTDRDMIVALFHRIGEQLELKEEWAKLPNAERSAMAGDFYNIIKMHTISTERVLEKMNGDVTATEPQKEYIIMEDELNLALDDMMTFCTSGTLKKVRSRIHSSTTSADTVLDTNAIDILKLLANEEPECQSSLSDMVRMLWDDYCESRGETDVEIG